MSHSINLLCTLSLLFSHLRSGYSLTKLKRQQRLKEKVFSGREGDLLIESITESAIHA